MATPKTDAEQIAALEAEGMTTSDAQSAVDAAKQPIRRKGQRRTPAEKIAADRARAEAAKARGRKAAEAKPAKVETPRAACLCGCGETPKGKKARYLAGHDARHHAALKAAGKKPTYVLSAEKRAAHAEKVRAKRAAKRAENDRLTREALDRVGIPSVTGPAPKVSRRGKAAQAAEAVAS